MHKPSENILMRWMHSLELSAVLTFFGILILFAISVLMTMILPEYLDPAWTSPTSHYQVQVYEVADPNLYIARSSSASDQIETVQHIKRGYTLLAFKEGATVRFIAPPELERYITRHGDETLKLTSDLLLLRTPQNGDVSGFDAVAAAKALHAQLKVSGPAQNLDYTVLELYAPTGDEAFVVAKNDQLYENYVGHNFEILDEAQRQGYHADPGVIYVENPKEYRVRFVPTGGAESYFYDPKGTPIANLEELRGAKFGFRSRQELIAMGEGIYKGEGCWYCHTDQTRTLIQDCVLNGTESCAAPPSSPGEYIYQSVTFPGTRRIGPDLSRVAIKRSGRDWHKAHFWYPKNATKGSIMPSYQHFFDFDPRGAHRENPGIPNLHFEAIYHYLMTKGSRMYPPTEAWWMGKDPLKTTEIIDKKELMSERGNEEGIEK